MGTRMADFSSVLVIVQLRVFSLLMHGDWPVNPCHPSQIAAAGVGNPGHRLLQATGRTPYRISMGESDWIHQGLLG